MPAVRDDPLRRQVESALADAARPRQGPRNRVVRTLAGVLLVFSAVVGLLVLAAPGALGLASEGDVDALRDRVTTLEATREADAANVGTRAALDERLTALEGRTAIALPAVCATLGALGDWSYLSGAAPVPVCPAAAEGTLRP